MSQAIEQGTTLLAVPVFYRGVLVALYHVELPDDRVRDYKARVAELAVTSALREYESLNVFQKESLLQPTLRAYGLTESELIRDQPVQIVPDLDGITEA